MVVSQRITCLLMAIGFISGTVGAGERVRHLGPTGLLGAIANRQIKVTKVQAGSPADGKVHVDDMIIGAGGARFKENARRELADAIDQAETKESRGILTLTLKGKAVAAPTLDGEGKPTGMDLDARAEDTHTVDLRLNVLGAYSDTAPYNCPKTDAIIAQTADYLVKTRKFGRSSMNIGLLGLLATGEPKYIDVVTDVLHEAEWAKPDIKLSLEGIYKSWSWGYTNLLLCEYYLLTGDKYVLPALKAYSVAIAQGRDAAGLWGHRMADPAANRGQLHGRLHGYAVMNQSSLPLFISLLLADKCGVEHPELRAGIEQTHTFYDSFIGRGTLPYGVHDPYTKMYNNNGMSGSAAVALALKGNTRGATFFSRMSAAAHNIIETGHTGYYFNQLWTGLGANLAGPETSAAFFKKTRWLHTINRTWDGNFTYDGGSYRGLSDAGSHLLNYCLGRGKLYITGRDADKSIWLKGQEVSDTIALAAMDYKSKSDKELLVLFGHYMPAVRVNAIWTLRAREHKLIGPIRRMVKKGTREQRQSAMGYFGYKCPPEQALPVLSDLGAVLRDPNEDSELRATAAYSLCWLGEAAYPYFDDMLKLAVADKPEDPLGRIDEQLGRSLNILCKDPYTAGLVKDRELFYAAVLKLLGHKRANGRTTGAKLIANIPLEEFRHVADNVRYIIDNKDLTYHSYHNLGPQTEAISILARLNIEEGIESAFDILEAETGKWGFKVRMLMNVLPKYGANAKPALAKLKGDPRLKNIELGKFGGTWKAMVKAIESSTETRKMISIEEAKKAGRGSEK